MYVILSDLIKEHLLKFFILVLLEDYAEKSNENKPIWVLLIGYSL